MSWFINSLKSNNDADDVASSQSEQASSGDRHVSSILRGVANFLAPPPSEGNSVIPPSSRSFDVDGIKNDLAEIGGTLKSSLSLLSPNKVVTGISELASQFLQSEGKNVEHDRDDDDDDGNSEIDDDDDDDRNDDVVPGTTDEVVSYVREISRRHECWTEFPSPLDHDFSMSNTQREHALSIERLVPELVSLRLNLCSYMNVEKFWMIYFLLVLPRLNQLDSERLSTPQIVEARGALMQKLQEKRDCQVEECDQPRPDQEHRGDSVTGRGFTPSEENNTSTEKNDVAKGVQIDDTEGVSFSDLEDDGSDLSDRTSRHRRAHDTRGSSPDGSSDWVQLSENSDRGGGSRRRTTHPKGKDSEDESNDWLDVDDF